MIKLKSLIENDYGPTFSGRTILVVDIQEEYKKAFGFDLSDYAKFINQNAKKNRIVITYNGPEQNGPSEHEILEWYIDIGVEEYLLIDEIEFIEKEYGDFRQLMDEIDPDDLVKLGKIMWENEYSDARDLTVIDWNKLDLPEVKELVEDGNTIWLSYDLMNNLNNLNNILLLGGGRYQCLAEVEIMLDILDKNYKRYEPFVYG